MRFTEKIALLERIDQLIQMKATGTSRKLAKRLGISKSTVYDIIETMKNMGADIAYCRCTESFYYVSDKVFIVGYLEKNKDKKFI